ncbi:MAG: hypothetical protein VXW30_06225 [Candidatus Thermoplasmatota archaeon]|nr:hypothetical protein [Candidatus Thermoplasmatota archaeon]MEC7143158.1 hypothetical protein [Candidatus Thermoplasmatota archaeon]MEC7435504.1 hypothetical protein [Candidatus Thermoplasmatota archaeon]MEC7462411.1 hypothetical protein [Candidatus Thermoplasmatota archaeon]MEC7545016.1 hypothetical protein [Candidatus Thermoplasmatota archaeon]
MSGGGHRASPIALVCILLSFSLAGCVSDTQPTEGFELIVDFENTSGTIVHSYVDGDLVSTSNVFLDFDFSNTVSSNQLIEFGIRLVHNGDTTSVNPDLTSQISIEFTHHGIYEIMAYAIGENGHEESKSIIVRIENEINWLESNTYNPKPITINPIPNPLGIFPASIIIDSTIENPVLIENIGGGREVEVTWSLFDQQEDACQTKNDIIYEGEEVNWNTIHFNTYELHDLTISYDEGQDYINIDHTILIQYSAIESSPTL